MILPDTNPEALFKVMLQEQEKVIYSLLKIGKKAEKNFFKSKRFPFVYTELYTVPDSKNTYLLFYYADSIKAATTEQVHMGSALLVNENNGSRSVYRIRRTTDVIEDKSVFDRKYDILTHFTGHFFSRYRERGKVSDKYNSLELIALYLGRNSYFDAKLYEDDVVKFPDKYKNCSAYQVRDGILFGSEDSYDDLLYVQHKTFVPHSMLKTGQTDHVMPSKMMYDYVDLLKKGVIVQNKNCYPNFFKK